MISDGLKNEIQEMENMGIDVVVTDSVGKMEYATKQNKNPEYCDSCQFLLFAPDPDPYDWFRDGDKKAVCTKLHIAIECSLELPSEMVNIKRPLFCPLIKDQLTEEEKREAKEAYRLCVLMCR